jgi:hypothetical protein
VDSDLQCAGYLAHCKTGPALVIVPVSRRCMVGNFPEAFSRVGLVNSALDLGMADVDGSQ